MDDFVDENVKGLDCIMIFGDRLCHIIFGLNIGYFVIIKYRGLTSHKDK